MRQIKSDVARRDWRDLLDEIQQNPHEAIQILRYDKPVAVVVSVDWCREAAELLDMAIRAVERGGFSIGDMEMLKDRYRDQAVALRRAQAAARRAPEDAGPLTARHSGKDIDPRRNTPASETARTEAQR